MNGKTGYIIELEGTLRNVTDKCATFEIKDDKILAVLGIHDPPRNGAKKPEACEINNREVFRHCHDGERFWLILRKKADQSNLAKMLGQDIKVLAKLTRYCYPGKPDRDGQKRFNAGVYLNYIKTR